MKRGKYTIADILKRPGAGLVLNPDGTIKTKGPHILDKATIHYKDGTSKVVVAADWQPKAGTPTPLAGVNPPTVIQCLDPTDIGSGTKDMSGNHLWTFPATSRQAAQQGQVSDCYFLGAIGQMLDSVPWYLEAICTKTLIAASGPGAIDVTYRRTLNAPVTVRTMGDLGTNYCRPDPISGAMAVCYIEKTYAYFRQGLNTYASLDYGNPLNVLGDLGIGSQLLTLGGFAGPNPNFITMVMAAVATGHTFSLLTNPTIPAGIPLIGSHCYVLMSVTVTGPGPTDYVMVVRNVWGFDGAGPYDSNPGDGLVTITGVQAFQAFSCVVDWTTLAPDVKPLPDIPGDADHSGIVDFADYATVSNNMDKGTTWEQGNFHGSGTTNFSDFVTLSNHYGMQIGG